MRATSALSARPPWPDGRECGHPCAASRTPTAAPAAAPRGRSPSSARVSASWPRPRSYDGRAHGAPTASLRPGRRVAGRVDARPDHEGRPESRAQCEFGGCSTQGGLRGRNYLRDTRPKPKRVLVLGVILWDGGAPDPPLGVPCGPRLATAKKERSGGRTSEEKERPATKAQLHYPTRRNSSGFRRRLFRRAAGLRGSNHHELLQEEGRRHPSCHGVTFAPGPPSFVLVVRQEVNKEGVTRPERAP